MRKSQQVLTAAATPPVLLWLWKPEGALCKALPSATRSRTFVHSWIHWGAVHTAKGMLCQEIQIQGFWLGVQEFVSITSSPDVSNGHQGLGALRRLSVSPFRLQDVPFWVSHSCHSGLG